MARSSTNSTSADAWLTSPLSSLDRPYAAQIFTLRVGERQFIRYPYDPGNYQPDGGLAESSTGMGTLQAAGADDIEVAAYAEVHPQARTVAEDLSNFVRKMRAGADSAITRYFFNLHAYVRFVEDAGRGRAHESIVRGVMPITNFAQLACFSDACGAEMPRCLRRCSRASATIAS